MSDNKEKVTTEKQSEKDETKVEVEIETTESSDTETSDETKVEGVKPTEPVAPVEQVKPVEPELSTEEKQQNRITELEDTLMRKVAEFENYKKRTARQHSDMIAFANEKTIGDVLDVVDNFDRALKQEDENITFESFTEGIKMIHNQLHAIIDKYDVKPIEAMGKQFDPNFHEALMHVESDEFKEGIVAFEMNKGYTMGGKVIRHSRVGVAKPKEENKEEENKNEDNKE